MAKGKLFALLAVFVALGVVTATGAFTTVSADRTATIDTAGDSSALLQITPGDESGEYVDDSGDTIEVDLADTSVNVDATTTMDEILNITNNGEDDVQLSIGVSGDDVNAIEHVTFETTSGDNITGSTSGLADSVTLPSGDTVELDLKLETDGLDSGDSILDQITIEANNDAET
jgi:hypothetical protein